MIHVALLRSSSGIVITETIVVSFLMFGTFSMLVRVTDMQTVGVWVLVNSMLGFARSADFWSRGLTSFVGEARGSGRAEDAAIFVTTAVLTGVIGFPILAALGAIVIWFYATPLVGEIYAGLVREILPLIAVSFCLLAVSGIYGGGFLAFARPGLKACQTIGGGVLFFVFTFFFAKSHGLLGILIAQTLQAVIVLVCSACLFHCSVVTGQPVRWRREQFNLLAAFGVKAIGVSMVQLAFEPVLRLLASQFGGLGAVTAVELASRLIHVVRSVITALGQILVPEFARLAVIGERELTVLYRDMSRLFLVASLSAFSLLATAAPALEFIVLGQIGTLFVELLWILSIGWFVNTVTSAAYFLLLSRRQLAPLFWSHVIMTFCAIILGFFGGAIGGVYLAFGGAALALVASSLYLVFVVDGGSAGLREFFANFTLEPTLLAPVLAAVLSLGVLRAFGLLQSDSTLGMVGYAIAIVCTMLACVVFGDIRNLFRLASRVR